MKKNTKPTDRKRTFAICGLSALCVAVLAGAYFLTREPEREFIPASTEVSDRTDTWEDHSAVDTGLPSAAAKENTQIQGTASDDTQTVVSEDEAAFLTAPPKRMLYRKNPQSLPLPRMISQIPTSSRNMNRLSSRRRPPRHPRIIPQKVPGHPPEAPALMTAIPDRSMIRSLAG